MLPFDSRDLSMRRSKPSSSGSLTSRFPDYLRRVCDYQQMDFDFAFSQMMTILSWNPQQV